MKKDLRLNKPNNIDYLSLYSKDVKYLSTSFKNGYEAAEKFFEFTEIIVNKNNRFFKEVAQEILKDKDETFANQFESYVMLKSSSFYC